MTQKLSTTEAAGTMVAPTRLIVSVAGVCGGDPCLAGTRVPVWVLEQARRLHFNLDEILEDYPFLTEADVRAAWDFADRHTAARLSRIGARSRWPNSWRTSNFPFASRMVCADSAMT